MRALAAMTALVLLAGCQIAIPDFRPGTPSGSGSGGSASGATGGGAGASSFDSARAEDLCRAAATDGGFSVNAIADNREVFGSDGMATGREVMLNVTRSGQSRTVRCAYSVASGEARLMVL
jgi:hypothetical protein